MGLTVTSSAIVVAPAIAVPAASTTVGVGPTATYARGTHVQTVQYGRPRGVSMAGPNRGTPRPCPIANGRSRRRRSPPTWVTTLAPAPRPRRRSLRGLKRRPTAGLTRAQPQSARSS